VHGMDVTINPETIGVVRNSISPSPPTKTYGLTRADFLIAFLGLK
jgi:hypothetical protein